MREIRRVIVHHSASPRTTSLETIRAWHTDPNRPGGAFQDIGYHRVIEHDGAQRVGRSLWLQGAHCPQDGANRDAIGVCVTGDNTKPEHAWNEAQILSLIEYLRAVRVVFPAIPVLGHRDVYGTSTLCPGLNVRELLKARGFDPTPNGDTT